MDVHVGECSICRCYYQNYLYYYFTQLELDLFEKVTTDVFATTWRGGGGGSGSVWVTQKPQLIFSWSHVKGRKDRGEGGLREGLVGGGGVEGEGE